MKTKTLFANIMAAVAIGGVMAAPVTASAQGSLSQESHRRQQKKNEWRNIGVGSAAVGLFGLLKHDNTLTFAGAAGALYSANRYEQDRKSQSRIDHARSDMFSRSSFDRDGRHYVRKTVYKNGKKYYQFVRK